MAARVFGRDVRLLRLGLASDLSQTESQLPSRLGVYKRTSFQVEQGGLVGCHGFRFGCSGLSESVLGNSAGESDESRCLLCADRRCQRKWRRPGREPTEHGLPCLLVQHPDQSAQTAGRCERQPTHFEKGDCWWFAPVARRKVIYVRWLFQRIINGSREAAGGNDQLPGM